MLVIDNGSPEGTKLTDGMVSGFGSEFRLIDMGPDAPPSPVAALNRGIDACQGDMVALMIDGAHMLTPGVLSHAMAATRAYGPAMVTTQPFHLGPGQQGTTMGDGYNQDTEDGLLADIEWPSDGYRLFDIGVFQEDRDWFDPLWESNCLFVPKVNLQQSGGYDVRFDEPGGGFANLELYERCGTDPSLRHVTILGEGSFHQIHGGTTTNQASAEQRAALIEQYAERYRELKGRSFTGPRATVHYVGSIETNTRRTKARPMTPQRLATEEAS